MKSRKHNFWTWGQRSELARLARIRSHHLAEILDQRSKRTISFAMARRLEAASAIVLDKPIDVITWLEHKTTKHPAFK
jgi:hypothetical protein